MPLSRLVPTLPFSPTSLPHAARPPHSLPLHLSISPSIVLSRSSSNFSCCVERGQTRNSSMAEMSLDLEDGESFLPSGILLGDDGWTGREERLRRHEIPRTQSFFSDGLAGLPCYPPDFFSPLPRELPSLSKSSSTHITLPRNSNLSSSLPYSLNGVGVAGGVYRSRGQQSSDCFHCYRSVSEGMRMAENRGRFYPSMGRKVHGGTGVFLPLPRYRGDWAKGQTTGTRENRKWVLPKRDYQAEIMADQQGKLALPNDWTY